MRHTKKNIKKLLAGILCGTMIASSYIIGFANAEPVQNEQISSFKDAADWSSGVAGSNWASGTRSVVDFSAIDANDTVYGDVVHYHYNSAGLMNGVDKFKSALGYTTPNKMLSFDFYIYDNTIPYEFRMMGYSADGKNSLFTGEVMINKNVQNNDEVDAVIGVNASAGTGAVPAETVKAALKTWHRFDAICSKTETSFYLDGKYLGKTIIPANSQELEYNTFNAIMVVSREKAQASGVNEKSGLYIDNVKVQAYTDDAEFYATATPDTDKITVDFSESIDTEYLNKAKSVKVYNTRTGAEVSIGSPVISQLSVMTIPYSGSLTQGDEYVVRLSKEIKSITGRIISGDVYFTIKLSGSKTYLDEAFTGTTEDVLLLDNGWSSYINVKDSGDTSRGKALTLNNSTLASATHLRWGVKSGDGGIDLNKGTAAIEFDVKIPNSNYTYMHIQPYTRMESLTDTEHLRTGFTGDGNWYSGSDIRKNQLCTLSIAGQTTMNTATAGTAYNFGTFVAGNSWLQMRVADDAPHAARDVNNANGTANYASAQIDPDVWNSIKLEIDGSGSAYVVKLYLKDNATGEYNHIGTKNTAKPSGDVNGNASDITNILRGIRFDMMTPAGTEGAVDLLQIDNVKFTGPMANDSITKIRMYNTDGESFGPMNDKGLKASADRAEIYLDGTVDTENAAVTLNGGGSTINTDVKFVEAENKLVATLKGVMKPNTAYNLVVSGLKNSEGADMDDRSVVFTTDEGGEFAIGGLRITDADGNEITDVSQVAKNQKVYAAATIINTTGEAKTALLMGVAYNDTAMTAANYAEVELAGYDRYAEPVELTVTDTSKLDIRAFVWESLDSNLPLVTEYICGAE